MVDPNDSRGVKSARQELSRRGIDVSKATVSVRNGICTIRGHVSRMAGAYEGGLGEEINSAVKAMRQRTEIKDVVLDVSGYLK